MKYLLTMLAVGVFLIGCEKESSTVNPNDELSLIQRAPAPKIDICHLKKNGNWQLRSIPESQWPKYQANGDVRLDDQDGDGFVPDNECGVGPMGDCDDLNADRFPGNEEICGDSIDQDCDGFDPECPYVCCFEDALQPITNIDFVCPAGVLPCNSSYARIKYLDGTLITVAKPGFCSSPDYGCYVCLTNPSPEITCSCVEYNSLTPLTEKSLINATHVFRKSTTSGLPR